MTKMFDEKKLVIFGKNSTICKSIVDKNGKSRPPSLLADQEYWQDVTPIIENLRAEGHVCAVVSNEGGVAWGILEESEANLLVQAAAEYISAATYRVSVTHPKGKIAQYAIESPDRMPAPGMLISIMNELNFTPDQTIMIGDWNDEKLAAEAAGVDFRYSHEFFGRVNPFADRLHAAMDMKS